jgi:hypothetical protein
LIGLLDTVRGHALSVLGPLAPSLLRDRERRVLVYGLTSIALACLLTATAPMVLLAFGPLLLGVPHLVADIRYLVARPALHRRAEFWLFVAAPAAMAFIHPHASLSMAAIAGAAAIARASLLARLVAGGAGVALVLACDHFGRTADLVLAHSHNAVAVVLFVAWSRRRSSAFVAGTFVVVACAIAAGLLDRARAPLAEENLLDVGGAGQLFATLSPFEDPILSLRAVLLFAFAQSIHYAVWLRLVPEVDRPRPGLRSFASSVRALREDLGVPLVLVAVTTCVAVAGWGCFSLANARDGYLRLAMFHGPLELGAATLLFLERARILGT